MCRNKSQSGNTEVKTNNTLILPSFFMTTSAVINSCRVDIANTGVCLTARDSPKAILPYVELVEIILKSFCTLVHSHLLKQRTCVVMTERLFPSLFYPDSSIDNGHFNSAVCHMGYETGRHRIRNVVDSRPDAIGNISKFHFRYCEGLSDKIEQKKQLITEEHKTFFLFF